MNYIFFIFMLGILVILVWGIPAVLSSFYGAPWSPTPKESVYTMLKLSEVSDKDLVYDLGSGFGRISLTASKEFNANSVGIEIDPIKFLISRIWARIESVEDKVEFRRGNFFDVDLSAADVVTCYLLHPTNKRLMQKFEKELRPGTRIVSHSFTFPGWEMVAKDEEKNLFLYIAGESY